MRRCTSGLQIKAPFQRYRRAGFGLLVRCAAVLRGLPPMSPDLLHAGVEVIRRAPPPYAASSRVSTPGRAPVEPPPAAHPASPLRARCGAFRDLRQTPGLVPVPGTASLHISRGPSRDPKDDAYVSLEPSQLEACRNHAGGFRRLHGAFVSTGSSCFWPTAPVSASSPSDGVSRPQGLKRK